MKLFSAVFVISLAAVGAARADVIPACAVPVGAAMVGFDQLPAAVRKALAQKTGPMAMPGQPFNVSDVVTSETRRLPFSRGIFVWSRGTRWVVATEHGGIGYGDPVYVFDAIADHKRVVLTTSKVATPTTVCATALDLLNTQ